MHEYSDKQIHVEVDTIHRHDTNNGPVHYVYACSQYSI